LSRASGCCGLYADFIVSDPLWLKGDEGDELRRNIFFLIVIVLCRMVNDDFPMQRSGGLGVGASDWLQQFSARVCSGAVQRDHCREHL